MWKDSAGMGKVGMLLRRPGDECKEGWRGPEGQAIYEIIAEEGARWARVQRGTLAVLLG